MAENYWDIDGESVSLQTLTIPKALATAYFLLSGVHPYARFVDARRLRDPVEAEVVIFDVDVEVGQEPVCDIRRLERIAAKFTAADEIPPEAAALRVDFPRVPHLMIGEEEFPRSLCLYDEPYDDIKIRWSPPAFVERVRDWLQQTATGALHGEDQPLEPMFLGSFWPIVIPAELISDSTIESQPDYLRVESCDAGPNRKVLVSQRVKPGKPGETSPVKLLATILRCQPQQHGIIHRVPQNLYELSQLVETAGLDLLKTLRERLDTWERHQAPHGAHLILIVFFPKKRTPSAAPESQDIWAFLIGETIGELGQVLDLWKLQDGVVGHLIGGELDRKKAEVVKIQVLNPTLTLSRARAAALSAIPPDDRRITAVGVGALGSQVIMRLLRSGYGKWVLVDDDFLLPHNVARHELTSCAVGFSKAETLSEWLGTVLDEDDVVTGLVANVLHPREQSDAVRKSFLNAQVIADFSASLAVARYLASDVNSVARRISLFLNPAGSDVVLLAEDSERKLSLDALEMQYYRQLPKNEELAGHLRPTQERIRYARSCRDLTSSIPGDSVALLAAIGSRGIREALAVDHATIRIWRSDTHMNIKAISIDTPLPAHILCSAWRICTDERFLGTITELRKSKLPRETGGVLVGAFDLQRQIIYVVDTIPSPPDSKEWPTLYIRGCKGLAEQVRKFKETTDGMLHYVGEWHSHPDGIGCLPSTDDRKVFAWLAEHVHPDGFPAVMLIAGEHENGWFVDSMPA